MITLISSQSMSDDILDALPATTSEIAVQFGEDQDLIRGMLAWLKKQGKAIRTERKKPTKAPRGRQYEFIWERKA